MVNRKNLWGEIPHIDNLRTPYILLKEQASLLTELTNGLMIGEIERSQYYSDHVDDVIALGFPETFPPGFTEDEIAELRSLHSLRMRQKDLKPISVLHLRIKVPTLNNYTISLLKVTYPVELYPAGVFSLVNQFERLCSDEAEFEQGIGEILSSPKVKRIVSALLSDVHVDQPAS